MIQFLKRLLGFSAESPSPSSPQNFLILDRESLARFLFSDKHFARTTGRVKRHAFSPRESMRLSVFQITGLHDDEIWRLGRETVAEPRGQSPRARADITATVVRAQSLDVVSAPDTHPRHAHIVGWPQEKEKILAIALELANKATLKLPSTSLSSRA